MTAVTFDPTTFRVLYPQFADVTAFPTLTLQANFDLATGYVANSTYSCKTVAVLTQMLNLMTAHLLALGAIIAAGGGTGQPGMVTGSSVGDVSVTLTPPPVKSEWAWWLALTPYGAQLLALLQMQSAGGFFVGGLPERAAFRRVGGGFGGVY